MERETLLTILLLLFGGLALQPIALLPLWQAKKEHPRIAERRAWLRLWLPVIPTFLIAACLCGWALREPDPVTTRFDHGLLIGASLPFALVVLRATLRAAWVLFCQPVEPLICTTGLWRPRIQFNPFLAHALDEGQIRAALEHERAHVRHRDPLRIWLAQIATDLQWPWPWTRKRFDMWLEILESTRDDEARRHGASGTDLAAAVVATTRYSHSVMQSGRAGRVLGIDAALLGDAHSLRVRIARLLAPLPEDGRLVNWTGFSDSMALVLLLILLCIAIYIGATFGNAILHPFFLWTWNI